MSHCWAQAFTIGVRTEKALEWNGKRRSEENGKGMPGDARSKFKAVELVICNEPV